MGEQCVALSKAVGSSAVTTRCPAMRRPRRACTARLLGLSAWPPKASKPVSSTQGRDGRGGGDAATIAPLYRSAAAQGVGA